MQLFYVPNIVNDTIILGETESRHCIKVLKLKRGDTMFITNGKGSLFETEIVDDHFKKCRVKVINEQKEYGRKDYILHIAIAPTKNTDRFEWFLEKATEIGINEITPLFCRNSERKTIKPDRLERVLQSAMKQSIKAYLPQLKNMAKFDEFVKESFLGNKYIAHCRADNLKHIKELYKPKSNALILIGPEGDFDETEIAVAKASGFEEVSLANSRLRTETAGVVACSVVNLVNE